MMEEMTEQEALKIWSASTTFVRPTSKVNYVKLENSKLIKNEAGQDEINKNFGKIFAYSFVEGSDEKVATEIKVGDEFFPIAVRALIDCGDWIESNGKKLPRYYSEEAKIGGDINLYNSLSKELEYSGPYKPVKEKYDLKYQLIAYISYKGLIYTWKIKGKNTLGSWFDVQNEIGKLNYPHKISLAGVLGNEAKGGIYWNDIAFGVGEKVNPIDAVQLMNAVKDSLPALADGPSGMVGPVSDGQHFDSLSEAKGKPKAIKEKAVHEPISKASEADLADFDEFLAKDPIE